MWRIESYLLVLRLSEVIGCIWSVWSACGEEMFSLQTASFARKEAL